MNKEINSIKENIKDREYLNKHLKVKAGVFISSFGIALMLKCKLANISTTTMIQGVPILLDY